MADDPGEAASAVRSMGMRPSNLQMLYTAASMVGIFGVTLC